MRVIASFSGFPEFFVLCIVFSMIHKNRRVPPKKGRPGNTYHVMWTEVNVGGGGSGGWVTDYKFVHNKPERSFLSVKWNTLDLVSGVLPNDQALDDEV